MWEEKVATANTLAIICLPRFYTYVGFPYKVMAGILDFSIRIHIAWEVVLNTIIASC